MKPALLVALVACAAGAADLRIGIVGTDTSHVPAFTALLNDPQHKEHIPGARVVAAYKGGSPDLPESANRVEKFAAEIQAKHGVEIVADIDTLCKKVDAVLLESVDGRVHLAQAREVFRCKKPVFIDKPLASTLEDAREIARLAKDAGVRWFSSSSLRFGRGVAPLKVPQMTGAIAWGPAPLHPTHQVDLTWYGIHAVEILYALMGPGCEEVTRVVTDGAEVVTGRWKDGRLGSVRLGRPSSAYGAVVFTPKQAVASGPDLYSGYRDMVVEIVKFFAGGPAPVAEAETLELFAFMEAAQRSKESGGQPARLR